MRYRNAREVFPAAIVEKLQEYVEGMYIYIPKKGRKQKEMGRKHFCQGTSANEERRHLPGIPAGYAKTGTGSEILSL